MRRRSVWALAFISALAIGIWLSTRSPVSQGVSDDVFLMGDPLARFTITEYADLECPYCRVAYPILKQFVAKHDYVNWQCRHLPLAIHGDAAVYEAREATCAVIITGKHAFGDVTEAIYRAGAARALEAWLALRNHADAEAIQKCTVENEEVAKIVTRHVNEAQLLGIDATPTLVIQDNESGKSLRLVGVTTADSLLSALDLLVSQ